VTSTTVPPTTRATPTTVVATTATTAATTATTIGASQEAERLPRGQDPGLAVIATAADRAGARALIAEVAVRGRGPKTGYERAAFGPAWTDDNPDLWGHDGCDTRDDILRRDLRGVGFRPGTHDCVVVSGTLGDPYTGRTIIFEKARATAVQIDHMVPLSYAWQLGAAQWSPQERRAFANDPRNLLAVDGPANEQKGDSGPASWLPADKANRCAYAARFAAVAVLYRLPLTPADKAVALAQC
jgi:hypothetical protein